MTFRIFIEKFAGSNVPPKAKPNRLSTHQYINNRTNIATGASPQYVTAFAKISPAGTLMDWKKSIIGFCSSNIASIISGLPYWYEVNKSLVVKYTSK